MNKEMKKLRDAFKRIEESNVKVDRLLIPIGSDGDKIIKDLKNLKK